MDFSFDELKYLVTVVGDDLLKDDFSHLLDSDSLDVNDPSIVIHQGFSDEIYDKVHLLSDLLCELYKHRPLPF